MQADLMEIDSSANTFQGRTYSESGGVRKNRRSSRMNDDKWLNDKSDIITRQRNSPYSKRNDAVGFKIAIDNLHWDVSEKVSLIFKSVFFYFTLTE